MQRISVARISRLIVGWQKQEDQPGRTNLPQRLSQAIARLIAARDIPVGALLPSERALAAALSVSRGTVVSAYALLRDAQMLASQHGSGYRVAASANSADAAGQAHTRLVGELPALAATSIDMTSGALPSSPTVVELLGSLQGRDLAALVTGLGYDAYGLPELRASVARYYCDLGLPTKAEQILITSGAQQAVWLIANAMLDASDGVVVEDPTYRGSLEAFRRRNARLLGVGVTHEGLDWQQLEKHLASGSRLLYLFTECQNPTGRSLNDESRRRLLALLAKYPTFLLEDGSQNELKLQAGATPRPMAGHCDAAQVATIGTLSKLFWGGLRVGWVRSSAAVIQRLASVKAVNDLGSSRLDQRIAVELLDRLGRARALRHAEIASHLAQAEAALHQWGAGQWRWHAPEGGTAVWVHMPGVDTVALSEAAARSGLLIAAGPGYSVAERWGDYLRLPFVRPAKTLEHSVALIAQLAREQKKQPAARM